MKKTPPYFDRIASGEYRIVLDDGVNYENFPGYANKWSKRLSLKILRTIDGPAERIWECERDGDLFWLSFDDWFPTIALEPQNKEAGSRIKLIGKEMGLSEE